MIIRIHVGKGLNEIYAKCDQIVVLGFASVAGLFVRSVLVMLLFQNKPLRIQACGFVVWFALQYMKFRDQIWTTYIKFNTIVISD